MKKILIIAILMVAAFSVQAQRVAATNINGTERVAIINGPETAAIDPTLPGTAIGSDFSVALYAGVDASSLAPVATGSILAAGLFNLNDVDTGLAAGSTGFFQVKAWETAFGSTYEEASVAAFPARHGESDVFSMTVTADVAGQPLPFAANLVQGGLGVIEVVPEPSTIVLGILGAGALLLRRRK